MSYSHIIKPKPQKKEDVSTKKIYNNNNNNHSSRVNNIHSSPNNIQSFIHKAYLLIYLLIMHGSIRYCSPQSKQAVWTTVISSLWLWFGQSDTILLTP